MYSSTILLTLCPGGARVAKKNQNIYNVIIIVKAKYVFIIFHNKRQFWKFIFENILLVKTYYLNFFNYFYSEYN
jgi:hypothetical protein